MSTLAKILSEDEKLEFAQVEEFTPEYINQLGNEAELDKVLFRIMKPHAHAARNDWEKRKTEQKKREEWLEVIVKNQNSLRMAQDRIKQLVTNSKEASPAGNFAGVVSR
jgi:catechol-2,3-dioxygenase